MTTPTPEQQAVDAAREKAVAAAYADHRPPPHWMKRTIDAYGYACQALGERIGREAAWAEAFKVVWHCAECSKALDPHGYNEAKARHEGREEHRCYWLPTEVNFRDQTRSERCACCSKKRTLTLAEVDAEQEATR